MFSRFSEAEFRLAFALGVIYFVLILVLGEQFGTSAEQLGDWGSWLAGTLTPALILFAFYSFRTAEKARLEQANAQKLMAEITERATFAANRLEFQNQLSYFGSCVIAGKRLSHNQHTAMIAEKRGGFEQLWSALNRISERHNENEHVKTLELLCQPEAEFFLDELQKGLLEVLRVAYTARLYYQVDRRLKALPSLFTEFKLWQFDPHIRVRTKPPSFEDFYSSDIDNNS